MKFLVFMRRFIKCHQLILVQASYSLAKQLLSIRLGYLKNKQVESINFLLLFQMRVWSLSQLTCPSQGLHKQTTIHSNCIQKGPRLDLNLGLNINYLPPPTASCYICITDYSGSIETAQKCHMWRF